jgi:hypothetical protein
METCYIISIALSMVIVILAVLIIILFLAYRKLKSKIYSNAKPLESEDNIEDRYFQERIENIKKKLS